MGGILIGNKHTERDWGLIWTDLSIPSPEIKTYAFEVPGMNGVIDLTDRMGGVKYRNRQLSFKFTNREKTIEEWHRLKSEIANYCHGKVMDIIIDSDKQFFWHGRIMVENRKEDQVHSTMTLVVDADPYKYDVLSSTDDWLWDSFSFVSGIIRNYASIAIVGTTTVDVIGTESQIVPTFVCSKAMTLVIGGKTFPLKAGENKNYDIVINPGTNTLRFTVSGEGTVSILFRGVSL